MGEKQKKIKYQDCLYKEQFIQPLFYFYTVLSKSLAVTELKCRSKNCSEDDKLSWMYDKGSMDTYKNVIDILEKEGIIRKLGEKE